MIMQDFKHVSEVADQKLFFLKKSPIKYLPPPLFISHVAFTLVV